MSAALRRSMGPFRARLTDELAAKPQVRTEFDSPEARDAHLTLLRMYKDRLVVKGTRFSEMYTKLVSQDYENANEQATVEHLAETDGNLLSEYDDAMGEITAAINEIESQREEERVVRTREEHADDNGQEVNGPVPVARAATVKLPKLELVKFNGDILKWQEFYDCFMASVHHNGSIQAIDKMNYLRAQLVGDAKKAIAGLAVTSDNYEVALKMLSDRFGKKQRVIDAHYSALAEIVPASNQTSKLRSVFDAIEQHLNSLQALGEDIEHRNFVSTIRSKMLADVIFRLEETRDDEEWTVSSLRDRLRRYLAARDLSEVQGCSANQNKSRSDNFGSKNFGSSSNRSTASALLSTPKEKSVPTCAYCSKDHWSDKCRTYPTVDARKKKILGNCFGCLKDGHGIKTCKEVKACYYCKQERNHHSSLCLKKFGRVGGTSAAAVTEVHKRGSVNDASAPADEGACLASGETVLLQTATTMVGAVDGSKSVSCRIFLDNGSQRSYITTKLMKELRLRQRNKGKLEVFTFGTQSRTDIDTSSVDVRIKLIDGNWLVITANVVDTITGHLQRAPIDAKKLDSPLLRKLPLADSIPRSYEMMNMDLLIGSDYYCDLLTAELVQISPGFYLLGTKLGFVLTRRHENSNSRKSPVATVFVAQASSNETSLLSFVPLDDQAIEKLDVKRFWDLETIGIKKHTGDVSDDEALSMFNDTLSFFLVVMLYVSCFDRIACGYVTMRVVPFCSSCFWLIGVT